MKYREKTLLRFGLAVAIGLGLLFAGSLAQEATTTQAKVEDPTLEEKIATYKVDISLKDSTPIAEYMELIQDQAPTQLNILISRNTTSVMVPPMNLKQVSVQAALNAMIAATESEGNWNFGDDGEVIIVERNLGYDEVWGGASVKVINASGILKSTEQASLLSAIEIGLGLRDSSKNNVTIKLHKETKLLFVKGSNADIKVVLQIVSELGGEPWPTKGSGGGFGGGGAPGPSQPGGGGFGGGGGGGQGGGTF